MVKQRAAGPTGLTGIAPIGDANKKRIQLQALLRQSILVPHWPVIVGYFFQYALGGPFLEPARMWREIPRLASNSSNLRTRRKQSRWMGSVRRSPIVHTLRATEHLFLPPVHSNPFDPLSP
jgi:hypothetical protein